MLNTLGAQRYIGVFLGLCAIGSLVFGWLHKPWWLFVPPVVISAAAFRVSAAMAARGAEIGMSRTKLLAPMIMPNIGLALLNSAYCVVFFFIAWFLAKLI